MHEQECEQGTLTAAPQAQRGPVFVNVERPEDAEAKRHRETEASARATRLQTGVFYRSHTTPHHPVTVPREPFLVGRADSPQTIR